MIEFEAFPKIPRLYREVVITEKIDGTNAAVRVTPVPAGAWVSADGALVPGDDYETDYLVSAQSRKRIITPDSDNYGFAAWVWENAPELTKLGPGVHFGEWWGRGIQRNYGQEERWFSLFDQRWAGYPPRGWVPPECCGVVPILATGVLSDNLVNDALADLRVNGSCAASGFERPEGIVVRHSASGHVFKVLLENDALPKSDVKAERIGGAVVVGP